MSDVIVIVPTRGRPQSAQRLAEAFAETSTATPVFVVDDSDPLVEEYKALVGRDHLVMVAPTGPPGMVFPTNYAARWLLPRYGASVVGFMGDDHLPRTVGWDAAVEFALEGLGSGFVYGNDLLMGEKLPTAVFMTSDIPEVLGYVAPPELHHLYVDNYWLDVGRAVDRIQYLPEVIIEHLHPGAAKAEWDPTYESANSPNVSRDGERYAKFAASGKLARDIEKVRGLL